MQNLRPPYRLVVACAVSLTVAMTTAGGCAGPQVVETEQAAALAQLPYPEDAERGEELDILVIRERGRLYLVNRTARTFEDVQLWLNEQYVSRVERIEIGTDNVLRLQDFFNRYQERFPTARLLAPDRARPVVSAVLYDPATDLRHPLTVTPVD